MPDSFERISRIRQAFCQQTPFCRLVRDMCDLTDELLSRTPDEDERERVVDEVVETLRKKWREALEERRQA